MLRPRRRAGGAFAPSAQPPLLAAAAPVLLALAACGGGGGAEVEQPAPEVVVPPPAPPVVASYQLIATGVEADDDRRVADGDRGRCAAGAGHGDLGHAVTRRARGSGNAPAPPSAVGADARRGRRRGRQRAEGEHGVDGRRRAQGARPVQRTAAGGPDLDLGRGRAARLGEDVARGRAGGDAADEVGADRRARSGSRCVAPWTSRILTGLAALVETRVVVADRFAVGRAAAGIGHQQGVVAAAADRARRQRHGDAVQVTTRLPPVGTRR